MMFSVIVQADIVLKRTVVQRSLTFQKPGNHGQMSSSDSRA